MKLGDLGFVLYYLRLQTFEIRLAYVTLNFTMKNKVTKIYLREGKNQTVMYPRKQ